MAGWDHPANSGPAGQKGGVGSRGRRGRGRGFPRHGARASMSAGLWCCALGWAVTLLEYCLSVLQLQTDAE